MAEPPPGENPVERRGSCGSPSSRLDMEEELLAAATTERCLSDGLRPLREEEDEAFSVVPPSSLARSTPLQASPSPSLPSSRQRPRTGEVRAAADPGVVLRCEQLAEEWHFDEASHAAKVEGLESHCRALKVREAAAQSRARAIDRDAAQRTEGVLHAAEAEEQERARRLADMRAELVELQHQEEQRREDCRQEVADLERQIQAERARCRGIEEALRDEPQSQARARRSLEELQDAEDAEMREKAEQIRGHRARAQREVMEVQRVAQERVREIERRMHADLAALKHELDEVLRQSQGVIQVAVQDRRQTRAAAQVEVSKVDRKILQGLTGTHRQALELRDEAVEQAREVQARDFALEALLHEHTDAALSSLGCATDEKKQAAMLEHAHKQRTAMAVKTLGETFPRSTQYQLNLDKKTRSAVLAAAAYAVVPGGKEADPVPVGATPWQTRTRLQAGDEGRSYEDVFAQIIARGQPA